NRTMIKRTFFEKGIGYASELALQNVRDLYKILQWNLENDIYFYRLSSDIIPWASEYEMEELPDYNQILAACLKAGNFAREHGMRLTSHPGPFNKLASPKERVFQLTYKDLKVHGDLFDMIGLPRTPYAKLNIHVGAAYGDKPFALDNFCRNFERLPENVRSRLTVENDDKTSLYSTLELYEGVYKRIGIPIVFDYHHHMLHPGGQTEQEALELALSTWGDIKPVVHYAESRSIEHNNPKIKPQAHSDMIRNPFDDYGNEFDVMIEAKHKELALLEYRDIMNKQRIAV
ncbi:MAG TPA: UV DNA damage repair endonuclease UvsE, partial [Balneola sp.]|nr:UV DNA damage repair endonuclease UvsE [Balneola sp.]